MFVNNKKLNEGLNAFTALVKSQRMVGMCWKISSTCAMFTKFYNTLTWKLLATK